MGHGPFVASDSCTHLVPGFNVTLDRWGVLFFFFN